MKFLESLIGFRSTYDNVPAMQDCMELFKETFSVFSYVTEHTYGDHEKPILVLANSPGKHFDLIFSGHIDVVPAVTEDQFTLKEDGENLIGRGVIDMKAALGIGTFGIADFLEKNPETDLRIAVIVTADEEIDGLSVRHVSKSLGYKAKLAVLPDGGHESGLVTNQKGFFQFKVTLGGISCHASRPWEGANPLNGMFLLYKELQKIIPNPTSADDWGSTLSMTAVNAGDTMAVNQIPSEVTAYFDMRFVTSGDKQKVVNFLEDYNCQYDVVAENDALLVDSETTPYIKELVQVLEDVSGKSTEFVRTCGTSDAVFFVEGGTPATLFKPNGGGEHADDEWVNTKSLMHTREIMFRFLEKIA